MTNCINIKSTTIKANSFYQQGYLNGKADAEVEHDKMCETCIHKVSKEDIDYLLELEAKRVKHETLKPIKDLLDSNVSQIYFREKVEEIVNEIN